jgi:hypothetical protein
VRLADLRIRRYALNILCVSKLDLCSYSVLWMTYIFCLFTQHLVVKAKWFTPASSRTVIRRGALNLHLVKFESKHAWNKNDPWTTFNSIHPCNILFWPDISDSSIKHIIDDDLQWL